MAAKEWDAFLAKEKTWKNGPGCVKNRKGAKERRHEEVRRGRWVKRGNEKEKGPMEGHVRSTLMGYMGGKGIGAHERC